MSKIVMFASGSGSNVENIYKCLKEREDLHFGKVYCNNPNAYVIERCANLGLECVVFSKKDFIQGGKVLNDLKSANPDLIVLAGFLWLIPSEMVKSFENKIINIHPALLPKYGGKGMYGMKVHQAVVDNQETESGITIHYVNERYDEGNIIAQAKCKIVETDSAEDVATKVHALEYEYFPKVIGSLL